MVQSFLKKQELKLYPFHGCQFGVVDLNGNPMKKGLDDCNKHGRVVKSFRNTFVMVRTLMVKAGVLR